MEKTNKAKAVAKAKERLQEVKQAFIKLQQIKKEQKLLKAQEDDNYEVLRTYVGETGNLDLGDGLRVTEKMLPPKLVSPLIKKEHDALVEKIIMEIGNPYVNMKLDLIAIEEAMKKGDQTVKNLMESYDLKIEREVQYYV